MGSRCRNCFAPCLSTGFTDIVSASRCCTGCSYNSIFFPAVGSCCRCVWQLGTCSAAHAALLMLLSNSSAGCNAVNYSCHGMSKLRNHFPFRLVTGCAGINIVSLRRTGRSHDCSKVPGMSKCRDFFCSCLSTGLAEIFLAAGFLTGRLLCNYAFCPGMLAVNVIESAEPVFPLCNIFPLLSSILVHIRNACQKSNFCSVCAGTNKCWDILLFCSFQNIPLILLILQYELNVIHSCFLNLARFVISPAHYIRYILIEIKGIRQFRPCILKTLFHICGIESCCRYNINTVWKNCLPFIFRIRRSGIHIYNCVALITYSLNVKLSILSNPCTYSVFSIIL